MFPAPEFGPVLEDGWILTGKATNADESSPPPPPPPPPPIPPIPPLMSALNGNSPVSPEKSGGGRELRRFGVASERTGVVRDSEWLVVFDAVVFAVACVVCLTAPSFSRLVLPVEVVVAVSLVPEAAVVSSICGRGDMACCMGDRRGQREKDGEEG